MKTKHLLIAIPIFALLLLSIGGRHGALFFLLAVQWFLPYSYLARPRGDLKRIEAVILAVLIPFLLWGAAALYRPFPATPAKLLHGRIINSGPMERLLYLAYSVVFLLAIAKLKPAPGGDRAPRGGGLASRCEEASLPRFRLAVAAAMSALFALDILGRRNIEDILLHGRIPGPPLADLAVLLFLQGYLAYDGSIARLEALDEGRREPAGSIFYDGWIALAWGAATVAYFMIKP